MTRLTKKTMCDVRAVQMATLHAEAIRMDRERDEFIKRAGIPAGLVCHYLYSTDALGQPRVIPEEHEYPY